MEHSSILDGLSASQAEAVTATEGVVRVIAGAGCGKTGVLTRRFAYLVNELGISPGHILCVTFTNKAANEMRSRIHSLTGDKDTGYINTFHGFCVSVLQEDSYAVSYPKKFIVLDNPDIDQMLQIIYDERGLTLRDMTFSDARDMIEIYKLYRAPEYYLDMINMSLEDLKEKYLASQSAKDIIFYGYLYQEKKCFALDYNDLIKFSLHIFSEREDIRLKWQKRLEYIMIDEFQDIDDLQYTLMEVLCAYHKNLFVVGDPDQTIYTWRGANIRYLMDLPSKYPGCRTIMTMDNYRSAPPILDAVNSLIAKNKTRVRKDLVPVLSGGEKPVCHMAANAEKEAEWIEERIEELASGGTALGDIAVLYRAHYVTRALETVFQKKELSYEVYSGIRFYDRREIKDALSYLRLLVYKDDLSFRRVCNVPKRNLGERRIAFLEEYAEKYGCSLYQALAENFDNDIFKGTGANGLLELVENLSAGIESRSVTEVLAAVMDRSGYERMLRTEGSQDRLDNLAELKQSIYDYEISCGEEAGAEDYLRRAALFTSSDEEVRAGRVRLMTVHAAKGLEFPVVFLCGMNEGIFPSRKIDTLEGMEEERRLAYVAMTRAEKQLFISGAGGRGFDGSVRFPSRFITDVDPGLLEFTEPLSPELIDAAKEHARGQSLMYKDNPDRFGEGQRVKHPVFGEGTVTGLEGAAYIIQFDGLATPRSISVTAKLEAIS
ncbi:MAG: UvrD-helicase domain-containing protein [Firmicutes bacterium]|nr:UvrD-helicase domain-containing protein [Bacillota bacterium]